MKNSVIIIILLMFIVSCKKDENAIQPTITIFGELSNQNQTIKIENDIDIESNARSYISNGTLTISDNLSSTAYSFLDSIYTPNSLDNLLSNVIYNFLFTTPDSVYQSSFLMPTPIIINDLNINTDSDLITSLNISLTVTQSKHFKIELFSGEIDSLTMDTTWFQTHLPLAIYDCINNSNVSITIPEDLFLSDDFDLVKLKLKSLDTKAATYFKLLYDYRKNQSTTNQFINPPKGDFDNANGIVYGTFTTSIIKGL